MFGCLHVSDSDLRHPTSDVRQRFFRSGTQKIGWQVTLDECRQNNGKVGTKFAVANRPSDVVSRIHVYVDLESRNENVDGRRTHQSNRRVGYMQPA